MASPSGQGLFVVTSTGQISNPVNGQTWAFIAGTPSQIWAYQGSQWTLVSNSLFDFGVGVLTSSQTLGFVAPDNLVLPVNCVSSVANVVSGSTSSAVFNIKDNTTIIGTITVNGTNANIYYN
jgi:hypothetical protein